MKTILELLEYLGQRTILVMGLGFLWLTFMTYMFKPEFYYWGVMPPIVLAIATQIGNTIAVFKKQKDARNRVYDCGPYGLLNWAVLSTYSFREHHLIFDFAYYWLLASVAWLCVLEVMCNRFHIDYIEQDEQTTPRSETSLVGK